MRRIKLFTSICGLLLAIVHIGFFPAWTIGFVQPNSVVAAIVIGVMLHVDQKLLLYAVISGGIVLDVYSSTWFGLITILCVLLVFFLSAIHKRFIHYSAPITIIIAASVSAFFFDSIVAILRGVWLSLGVRYFIENAFYTGAVSAMMLAMVYLINKRMLRSDEIYIRKRT